MPHTGRLCFLQLKSNANNARSAACDCGRTSIVSANNLIYFDVETTGLSETASIVCAATIKAGVVTRYVESPPGRLSPTTAARLANDLLASDAVVTFNGAAFDFKMLCRHLDDESLIAAVVKKCIYEHKDIMFDFLQVLCRVKWACPLRVIYVALMLTQMHVCNYARGVQVPQRIHDFSRKFACWE
jgi:uncharacterized protein YprB with RNaseH-like and TPR domain